MSCRSVTIAAVSRAAARRVLPRLRRLRLGNVGFVSSGQDAERDGVRCSTSERGNGNAGHLYGTTLDAATKDALLEYLKTK